MFDIKVLNNKKEAVKKLNKDEVNDIFKNAELNPIDNYNFSYRCRHKEYSLLCTIKKNMKYNNYRFEHLTKWNTVIVMSKGVMVYGKK